MKPFLYQIASLFYKQYGDQITSLAFVFPNRRAGLFFQKYLSEVAEHPLFSPSVLTINDLFMRLSGKQAADPINMLFLLYDIYIRKSHSTETFDEFLYWGEMLLNDFNDIDKYLVDARQLFSNVTDLNEIENGFDYLLPEQIEAIRSFWSTFNPKKNAPNQQEFLNVWSVLYDVYQELKDTLASKNLGYEGMIYKEVLEKLEKDNSFYWPYKKVIFVGLNALSTVEERFLLLLQKKGWADFYWDYASPKVNDPDNKASFFVKRNLQQFPSQWKLPKVEDIHSEIKVVGVSSGVGQAKYVYDLLESFCKGEEMSSDNALRTAVILPDEQMLVPVLNSIPESIKRINVTMGYPLTGTPIVSLMNYIFSLQKNIRNLDGITMFYYKDVLSILKHRYIVMSDTTLLEDLVTDITTNNKMYIPASELGKNELLADIFQPILSVRDFSDYLIKLLQSLNRQLTVSLKEEDENQVQKRTDLEQEYIFHYFATINRMKDMMRDMKVEMRLDTYFRLLRRITDLITIPFHGEPLSGLQIMGVLETRSLDFDRVIILSMNEGIFPLKKAANSFIPYNLRKGFGLPTYEHQDSIWAYHFYRLIHRASEVYLVYDTRSNGMKTGEVSRFVHQLRYHYQEKLTDQLVVYNVLSSKVQPLQIRKTPEVLHLLNEFHKGGKRAISASAVNTYLDCPMKFYFSTVEGLREEDEVSESVESDVFGSILHKVMEILYSDFQGKIVTADLLELVQKNQKKLTETISYAVSTIYLKTDKIRPLTGRLFLIGELIRQYVVKVLEQDRKLTPFKYIQSEKQIQTTFVIDEKNEINLKGFIDRIDEVDHVVRIIDYKSGTGTTQFNTMVDLFDSNLKKRPKAVMQVFMYAWMYGYEKSICPGIYYMRSLFESDFDSKVYQKENRKQYPVSDFTIYRHEFEEELRNCLSKIFDEETPFDQTTIEANCSYCPFKNICGK